MLITIFTPTYNRKHLLRGVYDSLCAQSVDSYVFEWLVVDDGSTDGTDELMKKLIVDSNISIRYLKKSNGGKHTAINLGTQQAHGELFWIVDSDDALPSDAIERVLNHIPEMRKNDAAGICGYMRHRDGQIIGNPRVEDTILASSIDMRYKMGIQGDMMEIFRTEILRQYPFPEISGEHFCPECLVWNRIALKHKLLLIPDLIYFRDYLDGGLTDNIVKIRMQSPIASMMTYSELFALDTPIKDKIKNGINYWRFAFCAKKRSVSLPLSTVLFAPIAYLMHLKDKKLLK